MTISRTAVSVTNFPIDEVAPKSVKTSIMVVEDEGLVAEDLEERLTRLDYHCCCTVDNGRDALEAVDRLKPDLVLMDIRIRGGMDGIEVARKLRASRTAVIFLTAHADNPTLDRARLAEPLDYVLKPFNDAELLATIEMALFRNRAESKLGKMESWLATTLDSIGDGVITTDLNAKVTFMNPTAELITGWRQRDALGKDFDEVFQLVDENTLEPCRQFLPQALAGSVVRLDDYYSLRHLKGQLVAVGDSMAPIREGEAISGAVVVFRDRTMHKRALDELQKLETRIRYSQKLESLGLLSAGIAHDFNNLLGIIQGNLALCLEEQDVPEPLAECLADIGLAVERGSQLCSQLLAHAGRGKLMSVNIDLAALVKSTSNLLRLAIPASIIMDFDFATDAALVVGDPRQLQQVIFNVVINAGEAIGPNPGKIVLALSSRWVSEAELQTCRLNPGRAEGHFVVLEVSDSGGGMDEKTLNRLFDHFFSTKLHGRGLGLAATAGVLRAHNASVCIDSLMGRGTTFRVFLPAASGSAAPRKPVKSGVPSSSKFRASGLVLVVDDEPAMRVVVRKMMEGLGLDVITANDGKQAVSLAAEARRSGLEPFLGLRYPAADIPAQARQLYLKVPLRILADSGALSVPLTGLEGRPPLDLSHARLRSMSPVHLRYLQNMKVSATLVASILVDQQLWGLLSCHHEHPKLPDDSLGRTALTVVALLSSCVQLDESKVRQRALEASQGFLRHIPRLLEGDADLGEKLIGDELGLMEIMGASGLCFCLESKIYTRGDIPPAQDLHRILLRLKERDQRLFATHHLEQDEPSLDGISRWAAGLLALKVPNAQNGWILWFRPEEASSIVWAGEPSKKLEKLNGEFILNPRQSFRAWKQSVQGQSRPWSQFEIATAEDVVRPSLLEVLGARQLRRTEALLPLQGILLQQVNDAVIIADLQGNITLWNEGAKRTLGWDSQEMLGENFFSHIAEVVPGDHARQFAQILAGQTISGEFLARNKEGCQVWLDAYYKLILDGSGRPAGMMGVSRDVSQRKELEEKFRQSHKMEAIGQLAGGIAHDFNNLLFVINCCSEVLLSDLPAPDPRREQVLAISEAGQRAAALTSQLLSFSRKATVEPRILNLSQVISGYLKMLTRLIGEDIELLTELDESTTVIRVDPGQLEQILLNLVVNARDAMPQGGKIWITTSPQKVQPGEGPMIRLTVTDNGPGMSKEVLSHLFEPFFTTKGVGKGTGLGLATVYGIVQQAGGRIAVCAPQGEGSSFSIDLPTTPGTAAAPLLIKGDVNAVGTETILLAEDDPQIQKVVRVIFNRLGYTVLCAKSGSQALEMTASHPGPIDLLVTDVVMPGMNGFELAKQMRLARPHIRVLFCSGYTGQDMSKRGELGAGEAFLAKPISTRVLTGKVRELLDMQI